MSDTDTIDIYADYGPLILGGLLAFAYGLSGCVNMQFIVYWKVYPEADRWTMKSLVTTTWFLDLCHSAFIAVAIWNSVIVPYGNLDMVDAIPWSVGPTVGLTAMITFLVQSFFAYRIYKLQRHKSIVAGPVFILAFIRLVAAIVSMVEFIKLKKYSIFIHPFPSWVFTLGLSASALVDIMITISLCYSLRENRSPVQSTNHIIDTLIVWTVQNGSITCLAAIATLVCWLVMQQNRVFLGLHFVVGKLYANSLLATLNARIKIREFRRSRNVSNQMHPVTTLPEIAFAEIEPGYGRVTPVGQTPYSTHLDRRVLQPIHMKSESRIEVSVSQTVESKYDHEDVDILSITAESTREAEGWRGV